MTHIVNLLKSLAKQIDILLISLLEFLYLKFYHAITNLSQHNFQFL